VVCPLSRTCSNLLLGSCPPGPACSYNKSVDHRESTVSLKYSTHPMPKLTHASRRLTRVGSVSPRYLKEDRWWQQASLETESQSQGVKGSRGQGVKGSRAGLQQSLVAVAGSKAAAGSSHTQQQKVTWKLKGCARTGAQDSRLKTKVDTNAK